jgi:hypothetical protein
LTTGNWQLATNNWQLFQQRCIMRVVPRTAAQKTAFFAARIEAWAEDPQGIGLTAAEVARLQEAVQEVRAAMLARKQAMEATRAATLACHLKLRRMARLGSGMMNKIRGAAAVSDDAGIYVQAKIPAPHPPGALPEPGTPYEPRIELAVNGHLTLRWKCDNPPGSGGTMYEVQRRIDNGPWQPLGMVGRKRRTDRNLPAGAVNILYQVRAVRSTRTGSPAIFPVRLSGTAEGAAVMRSAA